MGTITGSLMQDHRDCDAKYTELEETVVDHDWTLAMHNFKEFSSDLERHFRTEEEILFPEFEARTGNTHGPTSVMKMEHAQMREILEKIKGAITAENLDDCSGYLETLMILMQQHNMKEEQMLYAMCENVLSDDSDRLGGLIKDALS